MSAFYLEVYGLRNALRGTRSSDMIIGVLPSQCIENSKYMMKFKCCVGRFTGEYETHFSDAAAIEIAEQYLSACFSEILNRNNMTNRPPLNPCNIFSETNGIIRRGTTYKVAMFSFSEDNGIYGTVAPYEYIRRIKSIDVDEVTSVYRNANPSLFLLKNAN